jgi:hypothetical protein
MLPYRQLYKQKILLSNFTRINVAIDTSGIISPIRDARLDTIITVGSVAGGAGGCWVPLPFAAACASLSIALLGRGVAGAADEQGHTAQIQTVVAFLG